LIIKQNIKRNQGSKFMLTTDLVAAMNTSITPLEWSPVVGGIMLGCNVLAIILGKIGIKYPSAPPATPSPSFFGGFGLPAVLATTSLGHIIGVGVILGLHNMGTI
jgi:photosystem I subunit X